jgi:hypothetical protein
LRGAVEEQIKAMREPDGTIDQLIENWFEKK